MTLTKKLQQAIDNLPSFSSGEQLLEVDDARGTARMPARGPGHDGLRLYPAVASRRLPSRACRPTA